MVLQINSTARLIRRERLGVARIWLGIRSPGRASFQRKTENPNSRGPEKTFGLEALAARRPRLTNGVPTRSLHRIDALSHHR